MLRPETPHPPNTGMEDLEHAELDTQLLTGFVRARLASRIPLRPNDALHLRCIDTDIFSAYQGLEVISFSSSHTQRRLHLAMILLLFIRLRLFWN